MIPGNWIQIWFTRHKNVYKLFCEYSSCWYNAPCAIVPKWIAYIGKSNPFIASGTESMKAKENRRHKDASAHSSDHMLRTLQWRHTERDGLPNHQPHDSLLSLFIRRRSKKTSKLCVTGLCEGNSPVTGEFPAQRASNAENVSIWWRHHECWEISCDMVMFRLFS